MEELVEIRILVAVEDDYRAYRDVIATGIRVLRPHAEVDTTDLDALEEEVKRFKPEVVVCSRPDAADPNDGSTWIELSLDPLRPSKIRMGDRRWELSNPTVDVLLHVVDEAEKLGRTINVLGER